MDVTHPEALDPHPLASVDLERCRRFRRIMQDLHNRMIEKVTPTRYSACARKLGMLRDGDQLCINNDNELNILMDYCLYTHVSRGVTVAAMVLASLPPTRNIEEHLVRQALGRQEFSIFQVTDVLEGHGVVLHDLVRNERRTLVDEDLGSCTSTGCIVAGRIVPLPDYWIGTGSTFLLDELSASLLVTEFAPMWEDTRELEPALRTQFECEITAMTIGAALLAGTTGQIRPR